MNKPQKHAIVCKDCVHFLLNKREPDKSECRRTPVAYSVNDNSPIYWLTSDMRLSISERNCGIEARFFQPKPERPF